MLAGHNGIKLEINKNKIPGQEYAQVLEKLAIPFY